MSDSMPVGAPLRAKKTRLGLAGDRRTLKEGESAQLISLEFELPRALLVLVSLRDATSPDALANCTIRVVTGIDRSITEDETLANSNGINRTIVARSVQVTVVNPVGAVVPVVDVRAVCVPLDISVPPSLFGSTRSAFGSILDMSVDSIYGNPGAGYNAVAQSAVTVTIAAPIEVPKGVTVYNNSAANLFLKLWDGAGTGGSVDTVSDYTIKMVPGSYYEVPFGFTGAIAGVWDAAGAGFANVTFLRS